MKMWIVCGYHTGKVYAEHAERLKESLRTLDLPFDVVAIESAGDWYKNTQYKPTFLKMMLKKHSGTNLVYCDVDAIFCRPPDYFDTLDKTDKIDIAVHILDHSKRRRGNHVPEMLSGTIFLKNTKTTNQIIDEWILRCSAGGNLWDQRALAQILKNPKYRYAELPEEYTTIFDYMSDVKNPVIKHFQASREERRKKKGRKKGILALAPKRKTRTTTQNNGIHIKRMRP